MRRRNPIDLDEISFVVGPVIRREIPEALERAILAGAPDDVDYVGAGMTGIVFSSGGRAWKVARPFTNAETFRTEADFLREAGRIRVPGGRVARFYRFHEGPVVIEREYVAGKPRAKTDPAWAVLNAIMGKIGWERWGMPEFKEDSFVTTPDEEIVLVDAGFSHRRGDNLADYVEGVLDGRLKEALAPDIAWHLRMEAQEGRLSFERVERIFDRMARVPYLRSGVIEQRGDLAKRTLFKKNPHAPGVLDILERPFPLDVGFWGFEVGRDTDDEQKFGYLAPPGVSFKALPGELVVTVPDKPPKEDEDDVVRADFSGAMAVFTPEPIPADKVIEFGLYPDLRALPHFLLEIIGDTDYVELVNVGKYIHGAVALIHRDTYPAEKRTHRGKVQEYRISFFDKHGPSGHHNGDFAELVAEAVRDGYRVPTPGALDALFSE